MKEMHRTGNEKEDRNVVSLSKIGIYTLNQYRHYRANCLAITHKLGHLF